MRWRAGRAARIRWTRRSRCTPPTRSGKACPTGRSRGSRPSRDLRAVAAWSDLIAGSDDLLRAQVLHLHHLTPIHQAAATVMPDVPIVTHLHGTELKMLEAIARGEPGAGPHARWWAERMGEWARAADATIVISPHQHGEAVRLLDLDPASVHLVPDGVDVERFAVPRAERRGAPGALGRLARARPAGLGRGDQAPREHRVLRERGRRRLLRPRHRRAASGADVRRALPGLQARAAARARLRARPGTDGGARPARDLGRRAGRVGRRASPYPRRARSESTASSSPAGAATAICRAAWHAPTASSRRPRTSRSVSSTSRRWPRGCP